MSKYTPTRGERIKYFLIEVYRLLAFITVYVFIMWSIWVITEPTPLAFVVVATVLFGCALNVYGEEADW